MTSTDMDAVAPPDAELDKAILSGDPRRERYVLDRLSTRRKMAIVAFGQLTFGGAAIIIGGLLLPSWADHIDHMATFLSIYFSALTAVVMAYWGIGSYERNSFGGFGGGGYGNGGYSTTSSSFSSTTTPASHPPLVKTPRGAGE
jgi:hypothetical protein